MFVERLFQEGSLTDHKFKFYYSLSQACDASVTQQETVDGHIILNHTVKLFMHVPNVRINSVYQEGYVAEFQVSNSYNQSSFLSI